MANDLYASNLCQGIIIVKEDLTDKGRPYSPIYYTPLKGIFDSAIESGEVFDCKIVNYFWFNKPIDWEKITEFGDAIIAKYNKLAGFI